MSAVSDLGHVLVLAGGLSYEREVSLSSGRRVADALAGLGVEVELVDIDAQLLPRLLQDPPSAVFLAVHGIEGEDGGLRDALDLSGVPYVGATGAAARLAFDKPIAKAIVGRAGVSTPASVALQHAAFRDLGGPALLERVVERLGLPLVVKPARGGSALGVTVVRNAAELPAAMVGCYSYDGVALLERHVSGVELAVSVVDDGTGPVALPAVEIERVERHLRLRGALHRGHDRIPRAGPAERRGGRGCWCRGGARPPGSRPARHLPHRPDRRALTARSNTSRPTSRLA